MTNRRSQSKRINCRRDSSKHILTRWSDESVYCFDYAQKRQIEKINGEINSDNNSSKTSASSLLSLYRSVENTIV